MVITWNTMIKITLDSISSFEQLIGHSLNGFKMSIVLVIKPRKKCLNL